jgi:hypothetical protein
MARPADSAEYYRLRPIRVDPNIREATIMKLRSSLGRHECATIGMRRQEVVPSMRTKAIWQSRVVRFDHEWLVAR